MILQNNIAKKTKEKTGVALIGVLLGIVAFGLLLIPMAKWLMQTTQNVALNEASMDTLKERLEMQSIIEDAWYQINNSSYAEFESEIATKGKTWTKDIDGKYTLRINFGNEGKYTGSSCNIVSTFNVDDKHCRTANITLVSKSDESKAETTNTIKISTPSESQRIKTLTTGVTDLKGRMTTAENRFSSYYTKDQVDNSYYTKTQINSTLGNYYTKSETYNRSEVNSKDSTITTNTNNKFTTYYDTKTVVDNKIYAAFATVSTKPTYSNGQGYLEFDNGLVIQYGKLENVSFDEQWHNITFPKKFPHGALSMNVSISPTDGSLLKSNGFVKKEYASPYIKKDSLTQTGATIGVDIYYYGINGIIYWIAFGY